MTRNPLSKTRGEDKISTVREPVDIRVITHNIRYATTSPFKGEKLWSIRCPRLCSELVFNSTSIPATFICLQEVLHSQLVDILKTLNESSPEEDWDYIGVGRDDGKEAGEYSPVLYRRSVWKLVEWRTLWLSETPENPSKGWDAASIRIVTVGVFEHRKTEGLVLTMSTHFDDQGTKSRQESAILILKTIAVETKKRLFSAVVLGGDFNSAPDDIAYQIMTSSESEMEDCCLAVPHGKRYGNEFTFTSFGYVDNNPSRIDFIFARKADKVSYRTFAVLANRFDGGIYSSDHRACVADMQILAS